ncbi:MAG: hypothetical protein ACRERD_19485 [Candidatus Binatia bacterium]
MKNRSSWIVVVLSLTTSLFLAGCSNEESPTGAGPAEQIGREIDKAAQEAGKAMQEMQEKLGQKMEEAGEKMQEPEHPEGHGGH